MKSNLQKEQKKSTQNLRNLQLIVGAKREKPKALEYSKDNGCEEEREGQGRKIKFKTQYLVKLRSAVQI